jgi:hypothetical protein
MARVWAWIGAVGLSLLAFMMTAAAQYDRGRGEVVLPAVVMAWLGAGVGAVTLITFALARENSRARSIASGVAVVSVLVFLAAAFVALLVSFAQF